MSENQNGVLGLSDADEPVVVHSAGEEDTDLTTHAALVRQLIRMNKELVRLHDEIEMHGDKLDVQTEAINGLGQLVQWTVDGAKQIFQMFQSPAMLQGLMANFGMKQEGGSDVGPEH